MIGCQRLPMSYQPSLSVAAMVRATRIAVDHDCKMKMQKKIVVAFLPHDSLASVAIPLPGVADPRLECDVALIRDHRKRQT
mmetsp:Transcript_21287/g.51440  ORF Transcript_21287/g.51440 Transcript_21287/m.51440 type:complete len:81 (-) Transcript_21287:22-264(-)